MASIDQNSIALRLQNGDTQALEEIYWEYCKDLHGLALQYLRDEQLAEDAVHDVFLNIWNNRRDLDTNLSLRGFLFTSLKNHVLNMMKIHRRRILRQYEYTGINKPNDQNPDEVFETGELEHKDVTLRDGTKIRLGENSRLHIPDDFDSRSRSVKLEGQAYFEVVNNPDLEFGVNSFGTTIGVIGTAFNVNTIAGSNSVVVAVSKGKVFLEFESGPARKKEFLTENMVGFADLTSRVIRKENTDIHNYLSWIHGNIMFDETPFLKVIEQLERIYGISNSIESDGLSGFRLTANFPRGSVLSVLDTIAEGLDINYTFQDGIVYWSKKQ